MKKKIWAAVGVVAIFVAGFAVRAVTITQKDDVIPAALNEADNALEALVKRHQIQPLREMYENIKPGAVIYVDEEQETIYAQLEEAFVHPDKLRVGTAHVQGDGNYYDRLNWSLSASALLKFLGSTKLETTLKTKGATSVQTLVQGFNKTGATIASLNDAQLKPKYIDLMKENGIWVVQAVYRPEIVRVKFLGTDFVALDVDVDAIAADFQTEATVERGQGAELVMRNLVLGFRPWLLKFVESPEERAMYTSALERQGVPVSTSANFVIVEPGADQVDLAKSVVRSTGATIKLDKERKLREAVEQEKIDVVASLGAKAKELTDLQSAFTKTRQDLAGHVKKIETLEAAALESGKLITKMQGQLASSSPGSADLIKQLRSDISRRDATITTLNGKLSTAQETIDALRAAANKGGGDGADLTKCRRELKAANERNETLVAEAAEAAKALKKEQGDHGRTSTRLERCRELLAAEKRDHDRTKAALERATAGGGGDDEKTKEVAAELERAVKQARETIAAYRKVYGGVPRQVGTALVSRSPTDLDVKVSDPKLVGRRLIARFTDGRVASLVVTRPGSGRIPAKATLSFPQQAKGASLWLPGR